MKKVGGGREYRNLEYVLCVFVLFTLKIFFFSS